jgi:hypothetical protein
MACGGFRRALDLLGARSVAPDQRDGDRGLDFAQCNVSPVSTGARFGRTTQAIGTEAEALPALRTAGWAAGGHHAGPGEGPAHLCLKVMRPRVRS